MNAIMSREARLMKDKSLVEMTAVGYSPQGIIGVGTRGGRTGGMCSSQRVVSFVPHSFFV